MSSFSFTSDFVALFFSLFYRFCDWAKKMFDHKYSILIIIRFNDCPTWKCFQRHGCAQIRIEFASTAGDHIFPRDSLLNGILMFNGFFLGKWKGESIRKDLAKQVSMNKRPIGPDNLLRSRIMWIDKKKWIYEITIYLLTPGSDMD